MNAKKSWKDQIKGWIPKEPNITYAHKHSMRWRHSSWIALSLGGVSLITVSVIAFSTSGSFLDRLVQVFAWLTFAGPVVLLLAGLFLFRYKPLHRKTIGIIWTSLGGFGVMVFAFVLYFSSTIPSASVPRMLAISLVEVSVEICTIAVGIISLIKKVELKA